MPTRRDAARLPSDVFDGRMRQVVVIGAGQAGLSAAYYLTARGLQPWRDVVVFDANDGPGGAWRHRWNTLTFGRAHGIHPLPAAPLDAIDPTEPANRVVPRYYGGYERRFDLPVLRPVTVTRVVRNDAPDDDGRDDGGDDGRDGIRVPSFTVHTTGGDMIARAVISATGTWDSPYVPHYPGIEGFAGRQLHTRDYRSADEFAGQRVLVVGGGTSALQFIQELHAHDVDTVWTTRRAPQWTDRTFDQEWGRDVERRVSERTRQGLPPLSVSAATGIPLNDLYVGDIVSGLLVSRGTLVGFSPSAAVLDGPGPDGRGFPTQGAADRLVGVARVPRLPGRSVASLRAAGTGTDAGAGAGTIDDVMAATDGHAAAAPPNRLWQVPVDVVLWATGFRAHIPHLNGLGIRERSGGIVIADDGVTVARMPGVFLAGYGASASTVGATRAGRRTAMAALRFTAARV